MKWERSSPSLRRISRARWRTTFSQSGISSTRSCPSLPLWPSSWEISSTHSGTLESSWLWIAHSTMCECSGFIMQVEVSVQSWSSFIEWWEHPRFNQHIQSLKNLFRYLRLSRFCSSWSFSSWPTELRVKLSSIRTGFFNGTQLDKCSSTSFSYRIGKCTASCPLTRSKSKIQSPKGKKSPLLWIRICLNNCLLRCEHLWSGNETTIMDDCVAPDVNHINDFNYVTPIFLSIYLLIGNVMLLNLLIAIFTSVFEEVHENSNEVWKWEMYR